MRAPVSGATVPQARLVWNVLAGTVECVVLLSNPCRET